ncbi:MAG: hypothetical protein UY63_C0007G0012 [Parcubacteria group bacterium GW2011_GWA2_51_10]|nr:MAG: hypothetical protein UY63_C0007G0012 [Parcubacteria group bacterium GW2011_GWA2_51_10]
MFLEHLRTRQLVGILVVLSFVWIILVEFSIGTAQSLASSETGFTSQSPKGGAGGAIIPASCESGLGEGGFSHFSGDTFGDCGTTPTPVNGVCAATHYNCLVGEVPPPEKTCLQNEYCSGTVVSCHYVAPDGSGDLANSAQYPVTFGPWENPQCGIYGSGWHQGGISSCSTGQGSTNARCTSVVVQSDGQGTDTGSSWTWSCAGYNGGTTASCSESKICQDPLANNLGQPSPCTYPGGDLCPSDPGIQTTLPCPGGGGGGDLCPSDPGIQTTLPCPGGGGGGDLCPSDPGIQITLPCPSGGGGGDLCPSDPGIQITLPCPSGGGGDINCTDQVPGGSMDCLGARPILLRKGESTTLSWDVNNAISCLITGTNDYSCDKKKSQQCVATSPIFGQTTFTLSCSGAGGTFVSDTQIVNIIPTFQER